MANGDRAKFIDDLAKESLTQVTHNWGAQNRRPLGRGPKPVLSDSVHSLLASWTVAFFAPRGVRVYAAQDGRRVIPPPLDPGSTRRGLSRADEWSESSDSETLRGDSDEEERQARRDDMYLPRREREVRRSERSRMRRRDKRRMLDEEGRQGSSWAGGGRGRAGRRDGDWEVHFVCATPTLWTPGARPRTYGEPAVRLRR